MNQVDFYSNSQQGSKKMSIELEHRYENIIEDLGKQSNNLRYKIPKTSERKHGVVGVIGHWWRDSAASQAFGDMPGASQVPAEALRPSAVF